MGHACCAHKDEMPKVSPLKEKIILYKPLLIILAISLVTSAALSLAGHMSYMDGAMGLFLILIAALKLFDITGFAMSFARYDLLAGKVRAYALAYPFIELAFGILFLSGLIPLITNVAFIVIMVIGTAGVINTLRSGKSFQCACAGAGFSLPVGRVTLFENLVMLGMAALNLSHLL